jgi:hypothetical protein
MWGQVVVMVSGHECSISGRNSNPRHQLSPSNTVVAANYANVMIGVFVSNEKNVAFIFCPQVRDESR